MKKLLVLLLAFLMLFTTVACQTGGDGGGTTAGDEQNTTKPSGNQTTADPDAESSTPEEEETTDPDEDDEPYGPQEGDDEVDLDFSQYSYKNGNNPTLFSMLTRSDRWNAPEEFIVDPDKANKTVLELAVERRNADIEEMLGIAFDFPLVTEGNMPTTFTNDVGAGLYTYDIANLSAHLLGGIMGEGMLYNWQEVDEIGLDKVWWFSRSGFEYNMTVNGELFGITGDLSLTSIGKVLLMYFNMGELEDRTD